MSARFALTSLICLVGACAPVPPLTSPTANVSTANWAATCQGCDGWGDPAPPAKIFANVYAVGTCGITSLLVASPAGHILIDGGTRQGGAVVAANIAALGLKITDVRWILNTHEHFDHAEGISELQRLSGAKLAVMALAAPVLTTGKPDAADPQLGRLPPMAPARVDRVLADGEIVGVGPLRLTAHATYGHAPGSTSWTWRACEAGTCRAIAYADSTSSISNPGYRFSAHPEYVARFRASLAKMADLPCDILITPHPAASAMGERFGGSRPLVDSTACRRYAAAARVRLDERLAREAAGTEP